MTYPLLRLIGGRERSLRNRHPWVFSGAVAHCETDQPGAIVRIVGQGGEIYGYGHLFPQSPIRARVFAFTADPAPLFDTSFWHHKLAAAWRLRQTHLDLSATNGYRLLNAEGDHFPGLVIDRYANVAVVQARGAGVQALAPVWQRWLTESMGIEHVLQKAETPEASVWLVGGAEEVVFQESGLTYWVQPRLGQKTGFFLDQRDARSLVGRLARGLRVLNVFSYSGGFGVAALAGGATLATSVDISADACGLAVRNAEANGFQYRHNAIAADAFDYLRTEAAHLHDLIVLDPPAFTKHVATVEKASRGYKDLNLRAMKLLPPGGLLATFSCSQPVSRDLFRKIVFAAAADAGRPVRVLYQTGHTPDHPVDIFHPEGSYLKGLVVQVG